MKQHVFGTKRPRIGEAARELKAPSGPAIFGVELEAVSKDDGIHYWWKKGPVLVEIDPSYDSDRKVHDWRASIWLFRGDSETDVHEPVLQVWRSTAELCARYADRRLRALRNALGGQ